MKWLRTDLKWIKAQNKLIEAQNEFIEDHFKKGPQKNDLGAELKW